MNSRHEVEKYEVNLRRHFLEKDMQLKKPKQKLEKVARNL